MKDKFSNVLDKLKPKVLKTLTNTAQGYLFGCMVGLFTTEKRPTLKDIHSSGKTYAKLCGVYTVTESIVETVRQKEDPLNGIIGGALKGTVCVNGGLSRSSLIGGSALGLYSGLNIYLNKNNN